MRRKDLLTKSANLFVFLGIFLLSLGVFGVVILLSPFLINQVKKDFLSPIWLGKNPKTYVAGIKIEPINTDFSLVINKIQLNVPVVLEVNGDDHKIYFEALKEGAGHLKDTPLPDETGNTVIFGHSSGLPWIPGNYKDVFATLENLKKEDLISLYYKGKEYRYRVIAKKIVQKDDFSVIEPTEEKTLTLMTCYPFGFDKQRLVIVAHPN